LRGKNKELIDAAEKVFIADMVVGDEWVAGVESEMNVRGEWGEICLFKSESEMRNK
jgi:hypothetical protein